MQVTTKIENLSAEDMALGVLSSLRAAARAHYATANTGYTLAQAGAGTSQGHELPPSSVRRSFMRLAYDEVVKLLPANSPFREPLLAFRDAEVQSITD